MPCATSERDTLRGGGGPGAREALAGGRAARGYGALMVLRHDAGDGVSESPTGVDAHPVKRQRSLRASDSDWARVVALARAAGMGVSEFVIQRVLEPPSITPPPSSEPPERVRDEVVKGVLVLRELERRRMAEAGEEDVWSAVSEGVTHWLERERELG